MAVFKFDFMESVVVDYNFSESARAHDYNPTIMPVIACGFFTAVLSRELLECPEAGFEEKDKETLEGFVDSPIIWMEESGFQRYPEDELKAILLHEHGHISHHHLDGKTDSAVNLDFEVQADAYAAKVVGKRTLRRALKRSIFIIAERRFGKGEEATSFAKKYIRTSVEMKERLGALK